MDDGRRVTLYFSRPGAVVKLGSVAVVLAAIAWRSTIGLELVGPAVVLMLGVWMFSAAPRRIEVDDAGITVVPVTPLRKTRRYPFSALGPFVARDRKIGRTTVTGAEAPILDPALKSRFLRGHARDVLAFGTFYARSPSAPLLSSAELASALNGARAQFDDS